MKLNALVDISSGYTFRGRIEDVEGGRYAVVQPSTLDERGVRYDDLTRTDEIDPKGPHFLRPGDVLFVPRGPTNVAALVDRGVEDTIASSQLYILRPDDRLDPAFLTWYLNDDIAQTYFDTFARGSTVRMVNKKVLGDLDVPVPPIDVQRTIAALDALVYREAELTQRLGDRRRTLIRTLL